MYNSKNSDKNTRKRKQRSTPRKGATTTSNLARRMFTKLIKDENAMIRDKNDVLKFIQGMNSYANKAELLTILDDKRDLGLERITECLSMLDNSSDVDTILVPILLNIIDESTRKPLYRMMLNRVITSIYYIPGFISFLKEMDIANISTGSSATVLCSFLEIAVMILIEARNSAAVKEIARKLRERSIQGSKKLCALLIVDRKSSDEVNRSLNDQYYEKRPIACWVTDMKFPGGRHDNDFENFRDIELVPTPQEIICDESPWLPLKSGENSFIEDEEIKMLDANFRLLREDSVATIKTNITEREKVWYNARIVDVNCCHDNKTGGKGHIAQLSFKIQFDLQNSNKKQINWERYRALPYGGIVAFCHKDNDNVVKMATITVRRHDIEGSWLKANSPIIGVSFHSNEHFLSSLQEFAHNVPILTRMKEIEENLSAVKLSSRVGADVTSKELVDEYQNLSDKLISYDLIEASSSFFSYESALLALKDFQSVPLSRELVHCNLTAERPEYLPSKLIMPEKLFGHFECDLDNWSNESVVKSTSLDDSQADALRRAFSSRVALIQGPPGTGTYNQTFDHTLPCFRNSWLISKIGKTFIGSLVAQMIRDNTDESILCVCYTNHALDQFLEHLYDAGERKLVRIGGMSKSEKLQPYQVRTLARSKNLLSRDASRRMGAIIAQLHECNDTMKCLIEKIQQPLKWDSPEGGCNELLSFSHPKYHSYFTMLQDDEETFTIVGKRNKAITPSVLFEHWKNGMSCPEWLQDYIHLDPDLVAFWEYTSEQRSDLLQQWHDEILFGIKESLLQTMKNFEELNKEKQTISMQQDLDILKDARIIGATTSGAAKYREILASKSPGVVIVEEAGEVLEPHVLSSLSQESSTSKETKHLILIGDHLQLRPKVENYRLTTVSGLGYDLDCSLFERLIKSKFPSTMLEQQHRMRPEISEFIRNQTYLTLKDHPKVYNYPRVKGVKDSVIFIDHNEPEDNANDTMTLTTKTKMNTFEANMAVKIVKHFLLQGYAHDQITILTPYVGQILKIVAVMRATMSDLNAYISDLDKEEIQRDMEEGEEQVNEMESIKKGPRSKSVRCASIDNFQGEESDIIIISLVRSNEMGNIGFLKEAQRVNVLMSRAKKGLVLIGNSKTLKRSAKGSYLWNPIIETFEKRHTFFTGFPSICELHPTDGVVMIKNTSDFDKLCPNGGCIRPCNARLECGHVCPKACHPTDTKHILAHRQCSEPCRRFPPECNRNHKCYKLCKEKCGPCEAIVKPTQLQCGHVYEKPRCHDTRNEAAKIELSKRCNVIVTHTFQDCGHTALVTCASNRREKPKCPEKCRKVVLACGHECENRCYSCEGSHKCGKRCERVLFCGHVCDKECHGDSPCGKCTNGCETKCPHSSCQKLCSSLCSPCIEPCTWQCEHIGKCPLVCGAPCTRLPCQKRCEKVLGCGHRCPSLCGEDCPDRDYCFECCVKMKKEHVVDMICLTTYQEHDVDSDPIVVLPCGHFYATSTLDGLFQMNQAYEIDDDGNFINIRSLLDHCNDVKPKACPECRNIVHSVKRYGRLLSFVRLRVMERKHIMAIERSLLLVSRKIKQSYNKDDVVQIEKSLQRIEKDFAKGPMRKIFEACAADSRVEVPFPPTRPLIQAMKLSACVNQRKIEKNGDDEYKATKKKYEKAIELCDTSKSTRFGAELRISFAKMLLAFDVIDQVKGQVSELLYWITENATQFNDMIAHVQQIKEEMSKDTLAEVVKAMNVIDGYDYGGSWNTHWYECPNGHPYFIGDCGGANQTARCNECGEIIGGSSHRLLSSNRHVTGRVREALQNL